MIPTAPSGESIRDSGARAWPAALGRSAVLVGAVVVCTVVMAFLLLPIVALFTYQPVHDLFGNFGAKVATDAILVSVKTNLIAFVQAVRSPQGQATLQAAGFGKP